MTLTLRIPFEISPGYSFEPGVFRVEDTEVELQLRDPFHVLVVKGLESEEVARRLLTRLVGGLVWVSIEIGVGIRVNHEPQAITLRDLPAPSNSMVAGAFGIGNEGEAAIYPDDRPVRFALMGRPTVRLTGLVQQFAPRLEEGMGLISIERTLADPALRLAIDVFANSFFEGSPVASFLARITVLEILKTQAEQPSAVQSLIERFQRETAELVASQELDQNVADSLRGSLERLKKESIGAAIRNLVLNVLGPDAAKSATDLYAIRSKLFHKGTIPEDIIKRRLPDLTQIVKGLLRARLASASPSNPST